MKKIFNMIALAGVLFAASACYEILDQEPTDRYTDAQLWNDSFLLESHVAELYALTAVMVQDANCLWDKGPGNVDGSEWLYLIGCGVQVEGVGQANAVSDEAMYNFGASGSVQYKDMKTYGLRPNDIHWQWWGNAYYLHRQFNFFIEHCADSPLQNKDERIAEIRFLRAFSYFAMVKRYGGVPLITKVTELDDPEDVLYPPRNTEKEVWDFVISEALAAAEDLPENGEPGRTNKWAAYALASRAALYAGSVAKYGTVQLDGLCGIPASEAEGYFKQAYDASDKIIKEGGFKLYRGNADKVQNLKDIFLVKNNSEVIMVKQHSGTGLNLDGRNLWSWDILECPNPSVWGIGNYHSPYLDFVEEFEYKDGRPGKLDYAELQSHPWTMEELWGDKDPRFNAWIWTNGASWREAVGAPVFPDNTVSMYRGIILSNGDTLRAAPNAPDYEGVPRNGEQVKRIVEFSLRHSAFGINKYLDPKADNMQWFGYSTTDYIIFRYAEILLNHAEAAFELGKKDEAKADINDIRDRAGVPAKSSVTMDDIRHERMIELCFENHRFWDLRRWRKAVEVLDNRFYKGLTYYLDWESYKNGGTPKFWLEVETGVDGVTPCRFPENNYYFPIGNARITASKNTLVENPGYEN